MQRKLNEIPSQHRFRALPSVFYSNVQPEPLDQPELVIASSNCAELLGINPNSLSDTSSLRTLAGQTVPEDWQPLAMKYFGHQFGYLNPDLGDGRGLLMAEIDTPSGDVMELHLKGAGQTPYSRQGDGRAVLRSSIREFLCSEAMHALGIPSSRALCVVNSATPVYREQVETGASLMRVTRSHIRFGHFEFAYHSGDPAMLYKLSDYVCEHYFPCIFQNAPHGSEANKRQNADLFELIAQNTASLIAKWQCAGFAHGVMNTDNMSMLGETFDYGPFGFIDAFDPGYICNHSDHQGRYAFDRQPAIAHWNLSVLAHALSPILENETLQQGLQAFSERFNDSFITGMQHKLGLQNHQEEDPAFIFNTLNLLSKNRLDYSWFYRQLSEHEVSKVALEPIRERCLDIKGFDEWLSLYQERLGLEEKGEAARKALMLASNPKFILRNHLAQEAIADAEKGNYETVKRLHEVLRKPFEEQPEYEAYAALPPDWAQDIEISCSS